MKLLKWTKEIIDEKVIKACVNVCLFCTWQCEELKKEIKEEHMQWVSQYLVMKRASIEPNFHTLYANFAEALGIKEVTDLVILETFRNIKVRW